MPLDDQTRAFLEAANAKPAPPPADVPLAEFRAAVEAFRPLGFAFEEVRSVEAVTIAMDGGRSARARVYVPDVDGELPVVVWAHGGSWVRVTVDLLDHHFRVYANASGCAIVAVDYSLSPEARFPTAIEEVLAAGRWARQQAAERGWDPARIAVAGESSGGNLAAAAALLDRDRGQPVGFAHQTLIVPVLDAHFATPSWQALGTGYLLTAAQLEWAVEQYAPGVARDEPLLSPLCAADLTGLPSALVVTGEYDPLRDEGRRYAEALRAAGVAAEHVEYAGLIHHAIMVPGRIELGARMVRETAAAIGAALGALTPAR
jgi:acetyl esterase/lipase